MLSQSLAILLQVQAVKSFPCKERILRTGSARPNILQSYPFLHATMIVKYVYRISYLDLKMDYKYAQTIILRH